MSLINFHRVLIVFAILFCAGYGVYELPALNGSEGSGSLALSGFFFVCAVALGYYLWHLKSILGVDE